MKILFLSTTGWGWGGSEELWAAAAKAASEEGNQLLISVFAKLATAPKIVDLQARGAALFHNRPDSTSFPDRMARMLQWRLFKTPEHAPIHKRSPFRHVFQAMPDVICLNQGGCYDAAVLDDLQAFLNETTVPYVVVCQGCADVDFPNCGNRDRIAKYFGKASRIVFVSENNHAMVERHLARKVPNACVINNPVNLARRELANWPESTTLHLASVARVDAYVKGHDVLFAVLGSANWADRDWDLRLYGKGPDRDYLEQLARHYGIADRVRWMGHVSDVHALWADNHFFVMPSRREGGPLSLIEAMICGRPAVATDVGGNREWIEDGVTGFLAEAATVDSFGKALDRAWQARGEWREMGRRAHAAALAKMDPDPGRTLLEVLKEAAGKHH